MTKKRLAKNQATPKAAKRPSLKKMLTEMGLEFSMSDPHHASIPKTPENIEKLWQAGFPV